MEIEEEVVVGWQGSVFLWFLLPNGTSVAGPNTTEPPPLPRHSHTCTSEPSSSNLGPSALRPISQGFKQRRDFKQNVDSAVLAWIQGERTEQKLR